MYLALIHVLRKHMMIGTLPGWQLERCSTADRSHLCTKQGHKAISNFVSYEHLPFLS